MLRIADYIYISILIFISCILLIVPAIGLAYLLTLFIWYVTVTLNALVISIVGKINNPSHTYKNIMYSTFAWPAIFYTSIRDYGNSENILPS